MSYAVVKFINEGSDSEDEVVSEVPISWLVKNNKFCKWPTDQKYASIYITKNQPPQSQWEEFPVEVEYICDSLAEAKMRIKGGEKEEKVGRGFRKLKPTDYFSPAEEDERTLSKMKKRIPGIKKSPTDDNDMYEFMRDINRDIELVQGTEEHEDLIFQSSQEEQQINQGNIDVTPITQVDDLIFYPPLQNATAVSNRSVPSECSENTESTDILNKKLDTVVSLLYELKGDIATIKTFLGSLKLELNEMKQTVDNQSHRSENSEMETLQIDLPVNTLSQLEQLENIITTNKEQKSALFKHLKKIGGNDVKDHTVRICRSLFSNSVGELCSITGRKNNFPIGGLELINVAFGVVHQKSKCTRKDFEEVLSEWLRHSKQRRLREDIKNDRKNI